MDMAQHSLTWRVDRSPDIGKGGFFSVRTSSRSPDIYLPCGIAMGRTSIAVAACVQETYKYIRNYESGLIPASHFRQLRVLKEATR